MQLKLRGKLVAVQKNKKASKQQYAGNIIMPESEEFTGTVKYVGDEASKDIVVGQKVYFGTNFQTVRMLGQELCVMDDAQVLATLKEDSENV